MAKNISLICAILALIAVATLVLDYRFTPDATVLTADTANDEINVVPAPDFSFTDISGKKGNLASFKGRIVLLHFWATWCAPCQVEFPKLMAAAKAFPDDITVLAVASDDDRKALDAFLKHYHASSSGNIRIIQDKNRVITHDLFQTFSYPETIVIDRQQRMTRKIIGDADWTGPEMTSYLKDAVAGLAENGRNP